MNSSCLLAVLKVMLSPRSGASSSRVGRVGAGAVVACRVGEPNFVILCFFAVQGLKVKWLDMVDAGRLSHSSSYIYFLLSLCFPLQVLYFLIVISGLSVLIFI